MAYNSPLLSLSLCLLVLCHHGCSAARDPRQQQERLSRCRIQNLNPLQPSHRIQHQAGFTEQWDQRNDQFECAGVAATRHFFEPRGLMLPLFSNAAMLVEVYLEQCFLDAQKPTNRPSNRSPREEDKARGDLGTSTRRSVKSVKETSLPCPPEQPTGPTMTATANLSPWSSMTRVTMRTSLTKTSGFFLADNQQGRQPGSFRGQEESIGNNIFQGFDTDILAEAFGINRETARRLQSKNDERGNIVRVENGLRVLRQTGSEEEEGRPWRSNGLEETF
ncbi:hypothetical protein RJ639_011156 [Escallonia herrerae]|uniref:Cupin type-1 domain-containing protein n=1 Tax=Escallonia herrerae TaxID=1293975 RepID=A0AA89APU8_9ASTE|nr:hypothetical protein RJ639_011156 [Escallonia herrerae]